MLKLESMTGFGEASAVFSVEGKNFRLSCRARSLNHRFLELKVRLPRSEMTSLDMRIRKHATAQFRRGSVEILLAFEPEKEALPQLFDTGLAEKYFESAKTLASRLHLPAPTFDSLLRMPGVLTASSQSSSDASLCLELEEDEIMEKAVEPALAMLKKVRLEEGASLSKHLKTLCTELDSHAAAIAKLEPLEKEKGRKALSERITETLKLLSAENGSALAQGEQFQNRLTEEAAFWIERRDFDEERVRFSMHLKAFLAQLDSPNEATGKRLEFIQQELLRETNTLGTKAQSPEVTSHTIELKAILERVKEQLANVC